MKLGTPAPATPAAELARLQWTIAIVAGATLPHWPTLPFWVPVLLGVAIAWRLAIAALEWPVPIRTLRLLLALAAFCTVLFSYRTINGVEAGSALLVVMIALKVLESKGHRDQLVLIMLSYFLLFASLLTARGPFTAVYLLLLVWLTTVGLVQLSRRGPLLQLRSTGPLAGRLLLQSLPLMLALFVLFPRLPGPLWAVQGTSTSATSGLGDTVNPGDITSLALSDEIAFRVEFSSPPPPARDLYWRGPSMTNFDGRTWSMSVGDRRNVAASIEYLGAPTEYRVMLETTGRNWAFALEMPKLAPDERTLRMGSDYQLRTFPGIPRGTRLDYRVTSYTRFRALEPLVEGDEMFRRLPPESSPRTRALVRSWLADNPTPEQVIERGMDYLRSQPFFYTLTPPRLGEQPVDEFLFDTREGFCEHYASAFTADDARGRTAGEDRDGVSRRRAERRRRLLHHPSVRRTRVDRGLARGPRLGSRRPGLRGRARAGCARLVAQRARGRARAGQRAPPARMGAPRAARLGCGRDLLERVGRSATGRSCSAGCSTRSGSTAPPARNAGRSSCCRAWVRRSRAHSC